MAGFHGLVASVTDLGHGLGEADRGFRGVAFAKNQYDVVLVYPPAEVILEIYDVPDFPAIGIAYVGNYLEKTASITPALIDARLSRLSLQETIDAIVALRPKVIGISAMTSMVITADKVVRGVKERLPGVKAILGGFHATFLPDRTIQEFPSFDYLAVGESEVSFATLVQRLLRGEDCHGIHGIWFNDGEKIVSSGRGDIPPTLDELGEPGWHLYDPAVMAEYVKSLPVMTQRGCPFSCTFCSRPYGQLVRRRTPALVIDEIARNVDRFGVGKIHFYDETFTVDKKHTRSLCEGLIERGLPARLGFTSMVHANTIDLPLAKLMKQAGCVYVGYGVESGDDDIIKLMKKGVTKERLIRARKILRDAEITTMGYFMVGHPNETRRSIWRTIRFMAQLNPDVAAIGIVVPYPGTETWEMARKGEGGYVNMSLNWEDYNKQLGNAVELRNISRREVEFYQLCGYFLLYTLNLRFKDLFLIAHQHLPLLTSMLMKVLFPSRLQRKITLFRNDGGRMYLRKRKSMATEGWGKVSQPS
jgi:anaerobic magnesium-protoporphyrin IX monomethyl ester cyclase